MSNVIAVLAAVISAKKYAGVGKKEMLIYYVRLISWVDAISYADVP